MTVRVLVVDDSAFMRRRITEFLEEDSGIVVADVAQNGREAVRKAASVRPDVIMMDVEMPIMNGIEAVRRIMHRTPTPILMFSSLTQAGAQATLDALEAGALDFLPKRLEEIHGDRQAAKLVLRHRVRMLAAQRRKNKEPWDVPPSQTRFPPHAKSRVERGAERPQLLVIAASTGGPVALQTILSRLSPSISFPVVVVQHMPAHFTPSFAERLDRKARIKVQEAVDGDCLRPGSAFLAPGDKQLVLTGGNQVRLREPTFEETYRPSADVTFTSVAENFSGRVLALVLTGMGNDGQRGATRLKAAHAEIWTQDASSCIVYGMPKAVAEAGLADRILSLDQIADCFGAL